MERAARPPNDLGATLARIGGTTCHLLAYFGGAALLVTAAVRALVRPHEGALPLRRAVAHQLGWLLGMGLPLAGLVHVGIGSFLAMQAFFGATFVEAAGPVVGVGMARNVAPLLAGLTLAGMLATRTTAELKARQTRPLDGDPTWRPDRDAARGGQRRDATPTDPARLVAVRLLAAGIAGPVLALFGALIGTLVGFLVAHSMLGISEARFFHRMFAMLWLRDVAGLVVKGSIFGMSSALFACHEGLRPPEGPSATPVAAFRAACLSAVCILAINSTWFILAYLAGPPFGPTVLAPPGH